MGSLSLTFPKLTAVQSFKLQIFKEYFKPQTFQEYFKPQHIPKNNKWPIVDILKLRTGLFSFTTQSS